MMRNALATRDQQNQTINEPKRKETMKVVKEMEEEIFQVEEDLSFDEEFNNTLEAHLEQEQ